MNMDHMYLRSWICKNPFLSRSKDRPGINTASIEPQSVDGPVPGCLIEAPVTRHGWLTDIWDRAENCRYCAVIDDVLSYPELK